MSKEVVLKSQRYFDKHNVLVENTHFVPSVLAFPTMAIIVGVGAGIIPSMLTGLWEFSSILALTLPFTGIFSILFNESYREFMLKRRIFRMCKKIGISLSEKDRAKIKERVEKSHNFSIDLSYRGSKVVVKRANQSPHIKQVQVIKSPTSDFRAVFKEAVFLTVETIKSQVHEKFLIAKENPTPFDKAIETRMDSIYSALEKDDDNQFTFILQPTEQSVNFKFPEANTEFENLKEDYLKDLESRIAEHLDS